MKILLYNPDNGVTRNFMPHLWMFLLKALTPPEHEVLLIDGNAQALEQEFHQTGRVRRGIGAACPAQPARDHFLHIRIGQRHARRIAADARSISPVARRPARFRTVDALPIDASLCPAGGVRTVDRPKHWLDFAPYQMAHTPLKMTSAQA